VIVQRADTPALASHREVIRRAQLAPLLRGCGPILGLPARAGLTVRLTGNAELAELNARFLGIAEPTDVLAFPSDERGRVGDIAISVERAVAQGGAAPAAELRLLAVHGLLHCVGHDHGTPADAAAMTAATRALLPGQEVPPLRAADA
jgi:probable rRNA maturation factor